jgi:hypothetical protein
MSGDGFFFLSEGRRLFGRDAEVRSRSGDRDLNWSYGRRLVDGHDLVLRFFAGDFVEDGVGDDTSPLRRFRTHVGENG